MLDFLIRLDRRWVFLLMLLAVSTPVLLGLRFPEVTSPKVRTVFDTIEKLPAGSRVLITLDYDPASEGELTPMASGFTRHCCEKGLRLYYMTLWDRGPIMVQKMQTLIQKEYPERVYGRDYVNLGYRAGEKGVIKNALSDLTKEFSTDQSGQSLSHWPMTAGLKSLQEMDLIITVGSGSPGPQEWLQYAGAQYNVPMVAGTVGVQAPQLYPYLPKPLYGMLGAIKDAAEYEQALLLAYPKLAELPNAQEGMRRMGPQLVAHLLMVGLIVMGNLIAVFERKRRAA